MNNRRKILFVATVLLLVFAAAGAYAYWSQGGSGSGTATAGTTSSITVKQTNTVNGLYPGGLPVTLSGNFDNTNTSAVQISSVTAVVSSISNAGTDLSKPTCTSADFSIGGSMGAATIPSGSSVGSWTGLTIQLVNAGTNQDNCKGATANITYTANP